MRRKLTTAEDFAGRSDLLDDGSHHARALYDYRARELCQLATILCASPLAEAS